MSNKSSRNPNKGAAGPASPNASAAAATAAPNSATVPIKPAASGSVDAGCAVSAASPKGRPSIRMFNRYVILLASLVMVWLACRISIIPGHSSEDRDETISVFESDVTAVYREDPVGTRVPVDSIVSILVQVSHFFDRTLDPEISLVSWVFNREAGKLAKSLTEIATEMKEAWTHSMVKSEMTEKTGAVLDALISTIDMESIGNQHYSHNVNLSPVALARELAKLIEIICETLTGSQTSEQQTPSLRTANYIDYMRIKVDKVLLPDIIKEYAVLFKRMGLEKVLIGLKEILVEWRKEFRPES